MLGETKRVCIVFLSIEIKKKSAGNPPTIVADEDVK
jgi:hypothetical protein